MGKKLNHYIDALVSLFFPNICVACGTALAGNEKYACTNCLANLALTNFWKHKNNPIEEIFWGRVPVEAAASFVFFEKGGHFQHLLHHLKYKRKSEIGILLGKLYGNKLVESRLNNIDLIVPVPLHKSRYRNRGFNQSEMIAQGLSTSMKKPYNPEAVERIVATKTQTSKTRFDRWINVEGVFKVTKPESLIGKHLLVVDDVVTTGATSESFMQELLKVPGVKVSFVALASA